MSDVWERMSFNRYRDELLTQISVANEGVFPLRVIDLKATFDTNGGVVFSEPKDWNFHTISHTWSSEVRMLSTHVYDLSPPVSGRQEYNEVFKHVNLNKFRAYTDLLEFLKILQSDGVERAWFDALCVNKSDSHEMSRELAYMGAFYCHSLGCYVAPHGICRYSIGLTDKLPRWFSRVWTFHEFLLSKRLNFVVGMSRLDFLKVMSVVRRLHLKGACHCKGETRSSMWPWPGSTVRLKEFKELQQLFEEGTIKDIEMQEQLAGKLPGEVMPYHLSSQLAKHVYIYGQWMKLGMEENPERRSDTRDELTKLRLHPKYNDTATELLSAFMDVLPVELKSYLLLQAAKNDLDTELWLKNVEKEDMRNEDEAPSFIRGAVEQYGEEAEDVELDGAGDDEEAEFWRVLERSGCRCLHGHFQRVEVSCRVWPERMYLIDRDAYVFIMTQLEEEDEEHAMRVLMLRFWLLHDGGLPGIVREISLRECTREVDRVISVLPILGLDREAAPRLYGGTLNAQIAATCKMMAKCNRVQALITLCAAFERPYSSPNRISWEEVDQITYSHTPRISWAPHFLRQTDLPELFDVSEFPHKDFHHNVANVSVTESGQLSLSCSILKGRLLQYFDHTHHFASRDCYACVDVDSPDVSAEELMFRYVLQLDRGPNIPFKMSLNRKQSIYEAVILKPLNTAMVTGCMVFCMELVTLLTSDQSDVWLLLLGSIQRNQGPTQDILVFMVCAGKSREELQKIGILHLHPTCTIGRHGRSVVSPQKFECAIA